MTSQDTEYTVRHARDGKGLPALMVEHTAGGMSLHEHELLSAVLAARESEVWGDDPLGAALCDLLRDWHAGRVNPSDIGHMMETLRTAADDTVALHAAGCVVARRYPALTQD